VEQKEFCSALILFKNVSNESFPYPAPSNARLGIAQNKRSFGPTRKLKKALARFNGPQDDEIVW
jgi:hypothetical protein